MFNIVDPFNRLSDYCRSHVDCCWWLLTFIFNIINAVCRCIQLPSSSSTESPLSGTRKKSNWAHCGFFIFLFQHWGYDVFNQLLSVIKRQFNRWTKLLMNKDNQTRVSCHSLHRSLTYVIINSLNWHTYVIVSHKKSFILTAKIHNGLIRCKSWSKSRRSTTAAAEDKNKTFLEDIKSNHS